jgi:hypothetical protein
MTKGNTTQVAWIPEEFAKKTKVLMFKDSNGDWDDGWRVIEAGGTRLPEDVVVRQEKNFKEFSYHMNKFGNKKREALK